jgi:hypothetical protein
MFTISFITSKDIESEAFFFKQLLEHMSSDVCIHEFKLQTSKNETRGFEKWPAEMLSEILENPFIIQGPLSYNNHHSQQDVVRCSINPHSTICGLWAPAHLKLFLVSQPKIFETVWSADQYRLRCAMRTALELAESQGATHIYEVGFSQYQDLWPESSFKRISLSEEEFIRRVIQEPDTLRVALIPPELAKFTETLAKASRDAVSCHMEIGKNHLLVPIQQHTSAASVMLAYSLFCHYSGIQEPEKLLENLLHQNGEALKVKENLSIKQEILHQAENLPKSLFSNKIHHLFHIWRDLSSVPQTIVGFDIWALPATDPKQVGEGLQELALSYPFELVAIGCQGVEIYPTRSVPSLLMEEALQCRFSVSKTKNSLFKEISKFMAEVSTIYPWVRISLYREWAEAKTFLSVMQAG